jgi:hypothetical protein
MLNKHIWEQLEGSSARSHHLVMLRLHPQSNFNLFAALDSTSGHRFLLLKSHHCEAQPTQPLPSGRGFNVRFVVTASDREGSHCLQLELTEPAHADVFDVIGNDIIKNVVESANDKEAFSAFVVRIIEWQSFLDQLPSGGLSEPAQQGLFGELWFLREFLLHEVPPDRAIGSWAGPKALAKDFQFSGLAFEVKTSSAKQHSRFSINGELQLDSKGVGKLFLFCLLLERLVAGGMSLPELVAAIRLNLKSHPTAAVRFSELLLLLGYVDADAALYSTRFAIRSHHFFAVVDQFPRIVEKDLRPGVGEVRYSILFSECERYSIPEPKARDILRAIPL